MRFMRRFLVVLLAVGALGACGDSADSKGSSSGGGGGDTMPWERQFMFGTFALNTGDVTTNQDGVSSTYLSDFVLESDLPSANLEVFTVHAYLPHSDAYEIELAGTSVVVGFENGSDTPDIHQSSEFVQQATLDGQDYDVYRLTGFSTASPAITPDSFANVRFEIMVQYLDAGSVAHEETLTIEVYKR